MRFLAAFDSVQHSAGMTSARALAADEGRRRERQVLSLEDFYRHRAAVEKALKFRAAHLAQQARLLFGLDPFCHYLELKRLSQIYNGGD
jgi:hypothetical protein